jgi:DNA-binding NarL/FixJ family response regulator
MSVTQVLIVDDVEGVRRDLRTLLTLAGEIEIVGEASNGREATHLVETLSPQVVLMDLEMPVMDGYEATRRIKVLQPDCRVVVLSIHGGEAEQQGACQAGADRFVVKGAPLESLMEAIRGAPIFGQTPRGERP